MPVEFADRAPCPAAVAPYAVRTDRGGEAGASGAEVMAAHLIDKSARLLLTRKPAFVLFPPCAGVPDRSRLLGVVRYRCPVR